MVQFHSKQNDSTTETQGVYWVWENLRRNYNKRTGSRKTANRLMLHIKYQISFVNEQFAIIINAKIYLDTCVQSNKITMLPNCILIFLCIRKYFENKL